MNVISKAIPEFMFAMKGNWCQLTAEGKKTVEVRKRAPKETPFVGYIYGTKALDNAFLHGKNDAGYGLLTPGNEDAWGKDTQVWNGKVIGEFFCREVFDMWPGYAGNRGDDCLTFDQQESYLGDNGHGYGIVMSDVRIYDKPLDLDNFRRPCLMPEMPYCPCCPKGYVYISEDEACFPDDIGGQTTEWRCLNYLKAAPQSWCRVERIRCPKCV